ncbi:MAG: MBL fold metallo-hydrolase [Oscillospiraceae bacterium]|nr:MBL fold metallo-hydrolase [Oscillospiraceae bacterium]
MQINISDKITLMLTEQGFTYSNWLYIDDDVQAVIETGMDESGFQGLKPEGIDLIINSHHHLDHTRGNDLFPRAQIMIHELEAAVLKSDDLFIQYNSLDMWDELMPGSDVWEAFEEVGFNGYNRSYKPFDTTRKVTSIKDGQILDFGSVTAAVMHLPGHSVGHCCFWFPEEEFLFSSDICLTKAGPWYGEHLADPAEMVRSIDRIIELAPPRIVSSHIHELVENPLPRLVEFKQRIEKREERIYQYLLQRPSDIHALAAANLVYRAHPTNYVVFWEKLMLLKHLERLEALGLVRKAEGVYFGL